MRFPRPLRPGDTIGITAPSSGVPEELRPRMAAGLARLRERGFEVEVGDCLGADRIVSAPKEQRAAELVRMLSDPRIRAVVPPWGGETAIDLLDRVDWFALEAAEPTWLVGFSDLSTVMLPLSLRTGWATLHGSNLMDTPYDAPDGLLHWLDVASATEPFTQRSPGRYRDEGWDDYVGDPGVSAMTLAKEGTWWSLDGAPVDATGRLIGGCLETVCHLAGSPYGDVAAYGRAHADEGLIVFLEAAEHGAYDVCRALHGLRLAGWFDHASAVVIGRTRAPDEDGMTQAEAVADALGDLGVPVVLDVEVGHTQPFLPLVTGALAHLVLDGERREITQTLG